MTRFRFHRRRAAVVAAARPSRTPAASRPRRVRSRTGATHRSAPDPARRRAESDRSGLRHERRHHRRQAAIRLSGHDLSFLLQRLPHQVRSRSGELSRQAAPSGDGVLVVLRRRTAEIPQPAQTASCCGGHDHDISTLTRGNGDRPGLRHECRHHAQANRNSTYQGTTYHFCCNGCRAKFEADPESFLAKQRQAETAASSCCGGAKAKASEPKQAASCCGGDDHAAHQLAHAEDMEIDPVCGMTRRSRRPRKHQLRLPGRDLSFLLRRLPHQVRRRPGVLSRPSKRSPQPAVPEGTIYTCPMHPEIRQVGPGTCPICGMALEPETVDARRRGPNPELVDMTRRFWIGLVLALPVFVLEMGGHLVGASRLGRPDAVELDSVRASRRRSCCGPAGRSSCAAGHRS